MDLFKLVGKIAIDSAEAEENIKNTTKQAKGASEGIGSAFKKVGAAVGAYLTVDKIKDFGLACINAAADANAANSQFTQVFGDLESKAKSSLAGIADETGIVENRMKGSYTQIAAFAKTSGMDTESALNLSNRAMRAVADSAAFYDRSLEDTTESLQSFLKGNFENDAALGLSATETTRNAAANKLYGKSFKDLSESQKQLTLLQMVEDANKTSGALGQAARESNTWTNQTGNLKQAWTDFQSVLGQPILQAVVNIVGGLAQKITGLTEKFTTGTNPVQFFVDKIKVAKDWFVDLASYAASTFQPTFENIKNTFTTVKDTLQPLIDKVVDFVTEGNLAEGATNTIKTAMDLLAGTAETLSGLVEGVATGFQNMVTWGKENETALTLVGIAMGTVTAAIVAYNIAQAIKNAGGIVELVQLAALQLGIWGLTAAEAAHTVATTIATAATTAFGAAVAFLTSPITLVVLAIGALIAIGVLLYKNWDTVKAKCAEFIENVKAKFESFKESAGKAIDKVVEFFKQLPGKIWTWLQNAIDKLKTWGSNVVAKAKEAGSNFLNKIVEFFKQLPGKVWDWLVNVVTKVTTWASNMASKAKTAATTFLNNVINTIKELPGKAATWLTNAAGKVVEWGSSLASKGKAAALKLFNAVVNKIKELPGKIKTAGKDLVTGLWNGITDKFDWLTGKIKGFANNVTDKIKSFFGIKSPSTVMRDEVGRYLAEGVAVGIDEKASVAEEAAEKLGEKILQAAEKRLDEFQTYNDMTLAEEVGYWDEVRKLCAEGTDARLEADKKYLDAKKSLDDQILSAEQEFQKKLEAARNKVTERKNSILGSFDLFGDGTSKSPAYNLHQQTQEIENYYNAINELEAKIGGTAYYEAIKAEGMSVSAEIQGLLGMTDAALQDCVRLYDKRNDIAEKLALDEVGAEVAADTQAAYDAYSSTFTKLGVEIPENTATFENSVVTSFSNIAASAGTAMTSFSGAVVENFQKAETTILSLVQTINDALGALFGVSIGGEITGGIGNELNNGIDRISSFADTANTKAATVVEQNSIIITIMQQMQQMIHQNFQQLIQSSQRSITLDTGVLVGEMAEPMNEALGKLSAKADRGA